MEETGHVQLGTLIAYEAPQMNFQNRNPHVILLKHRDVRRNRASAYPLSLLPSSNNTSMAAEATCKRTVNIQSLPTEVLYVSQPRSRPFHARPGFDTDVHFSRMIRDNIDQPTDHLSFSNSCAAV